MDSHNDGSSKDSTAITKKELERERSKKNRNNIRSVIGEIAGIIGTENLNQNRSLSVAVSLLTLNSFHEDGSGLQFLNQPPCIKMENATPEFYYDSSFLDKLFSEPLLPKIDRVCIKSVLSAINSIAVAFKTDGTVLYESTNLVQCIGIKSTLISENISSLFYNSHFILDAIFKNSRFVVLCKIKFGKREETRNGFHVMRGKILENGNGERIYLGYVKLKCSIAANPAHLFHIEEIVISATTFEYLSDRSYLMDRLLGFDTNANDFFQHLHPNSLQTMVEAKEGLEAQGYHQTTFEFVTRDGHSLLVYSYLFEHPEQERVIVSYNIPFAVVTGDNISPDSVMDSTCFIDNTTAWSYLMEWLNKSDV